MLSAAAASRLYTQMKFLLRGAAGSHLPCTTAALGSPMPLLLGLTAGLGVEAPGEEAKCVPELGRKVQLKAEFAVWRAKG